jgi:hypothetical protein
MFKVSQISFCNKLVPNLVDDKDKHEVMDSLKANYNLTYDFKDSLSLKDNFCKNVASNKHVFVVNSTGNNYLLYLTRHNGNNLCLFIDRKTKQGHKFPRILSVKYKFAEELFQGTLFSGELIQVNGNSKFVFTDIYTYMGKNLITSEDTKRLVSHNKNVIFKFNLMYKILKDMYTSDHLFEPCPLEIKKVFPLDRLEYVTGELQKKSSYDFRGITFIPLNKKHYKMFLFLNRPQRTLTSDNDKRKNDGKNSEVNTNLDEKYNIKIYIENHIDSNPKAKVIFKVKNSAPEIYDIYLYDDDKRVIDKKIDILFINTAKDSSLIREMFKGGTTYNEETGESNVQESVNVKCKYNMDKKRWVPIKSTSKDYFTVNEVKNKLSN